MAISAAIFDVDGVLVESPHVRAWRRALAGLADPDLLTTEFYQANVAGKPTLAGALATLGSLGVPDAVARAPAFAEAKQALIDKLIANGDFAAFPDAVRFADDLHAAGFRLAVASSSKTIHAMLRRLKLPEGRELLSIFDVDISGRNAPRGKPALFRLAAAELGAAPEQCLVVEDTPAGIAAAKVGGMTALGIARLGDQALLRAARADLVVTSLDQVDVAALKQGRLRARAGTESSRHEVLEPTQEPGWVERHHGYDVLTESAVESRFALSNGFMGMRGARIVNRGPTWVSWLGSVRWASWPRFYVAGLFDTPNTEPPVPALVPVADWTRVRIVLDGEVVLEREGELMSGVRQLDMRRGLLLSSMTHRTPAGITTTAHELRLLSQADRAAALQFVRFSVDRDDVDVRVEASVLLAGGMEPALLESELGVWRTESSGKSVALASAARLVVDGVSLEPSRPFPLRWVWNWRSLAGQPVEFDRIVGVGRADTPEHDPAPAARSALARNRALGWRAALEAHEAAWNARWTASDVVIDGDVDVQRGMRFAAYHLNSAANPEDERVSIGARALSGDAYFGHVFWDTEIYLLPFYLATWPEAARTLLMYRYQTLPAARAKAAQSGWKGALYAWESADTGQETTPERVTASDGSKVEILCGKLEQHISADIAYAVWRYWRASGDDEFFLSAGAEIILETARFWASRAVPEADGKRHIRHVIGPDEYHEDVDDNAFTNVMARWNIARGLETVDLLRERRSDWGAKLRAQLGLTDAELADWRDAVDRIVTGLDPATGLYEQFAGFHALESLDVAAQRGGKVPIDVVIGRERTQASQVVKQADVVALMALLPEEFPGAMAETNFRHYEPRCGHGSSLSPAMHALVAARLGDTELALRYLHAILDFDPDPSAAGGVRIAGLGGFWQAVVMGFGGLDFINDVPSIEPKLPPQWRSLAYRARSRGRTVAVHVTADEVEATLVEGEDVQIRIAGRLQTLTTGETVRVATRHSLVSHDTMA